MAQWGRELATKCDNLSSVPRTHVVEENLVLQMPSNLHMHIMCVTHTHTRTNAHTHMHARAHIQAYTHTRARTHIACTHAHTQ